ncbi:hypothetical protein Are01nite_17450 [Actinoplanes regularis]|nr:hypothetical protein Are01nite_17450 [Actinoplanes regularis]
MLEEKPPATYRPIAVARRSLGNSSLISSRPGAKTSARKTPAQAWFTRSSWYDVSTANAAASRFVPSRPVRNSVRGENRSARKPDGTCIRA